MVKYTCTYKKLSFTKVIDPTVVNKSSDLILAWRKISHGITEIIKVAGIDTEIYEFDLNSRVVGEITYNPDDNAVLLLSGQGNEVDGDLNTYLEVNRTSNGSADMRVLNMHFATPIDAFICLTWLRSSTGVRLKCNINGITEFTCDAGANTKQTHTGFFTGLTDIDIIYSSDAANYIGKIYEILVLPTGNEKQKVTGSGETIIELETQTKNDYYFVGVKTKGNSFRYSVFQLDLLAVTETKLEVEW